MTQKEINKFLANTKVYVAGKSKEIQEKLFSLGYSWNNDCTGTDVCHTKSPFLFIYEDTSITMSSDMDIFCYHKNSEITAEEILALEITEPTYRPFKDVEECWQEMLKHEPFGWLKSKGGGNFSHVGDVYQFGNKAYIKWGTNKQKYLTINSVFEDYTFPDGAPFGIKED